LRVLSKMRLVVRPKGKGANMLIGVLWTILALVIVLIIVIAIQPASFRVTRSVTIAAPPAAVFENVNDLHKWQAWSPWAKIDPNMKTTYEGSPAGDGAIMSWSGDNKVGEGPLSKAGQAIWSRSSSNFSARSKQRTEPNSLSFLKALAPTSLGA
jgi:hypothetical protein